MNNLGIDAVKVEGKAAQELFKQIIDEVINSKSKEKVPNKNERKSREEYNK